MEAYKRWVRRNRDYVHSMESLANGLTWLLPERFSESEIGPEAVTSFFGVITAINEHIIETTPTQRVPAQAEPSSFPYSLCITLIKDLETLVEVAAQQFYGDDRKWNFIAVTEAIKVLVRLAMFRNSGYKMLLHGGESVNSDKGSNVSIEKPGPFGKAGNLNGPVNSRYYNNHIPWNLEGRALSALNRFGENARMVSDPSWLNRVRHHHAMVEPATVMDEIEKPSLSNFLSEKGIPGGLFVMGEVMFIIRPLVYVLLIRKYGTRSWFPWFTSMIVDLVGNSLLSYVTMMRNSAKAPLFHLSKDEKDELKRRKLLWALYIMRDPFFAKYTRSRLDRTQKLLEPVPFVGFLAEKIIELLVGAQTRYTYMSGS
ncbi:OLC1v1039040C1 [Oldenlandia corymbosa var. corymbosa]|uniref:Peroxisomal membrane protein PEX16 n=1 Tax=Oldenlandia corymbosa var. corymbosa TaxID=529605 RepID=A0AAV1D195_OLDCO|nr:OLC1v1039040C1 [Oldenlandia corymbosa var. corymbosa]